MDFFAESLVIGMCSFCLLASMELILKPHSSLFYLHSNDMNSLESLFLINIFSNACPQLICHQIVWWGKGHQVHKLIEYAIELPHVQCICNCLNANDRAVCWLSDENCVLNHTAIYMYVCVLEQYTWNTVEPCYSEPLKCSHLVSQDILVRYGLRNQ